MTPDYDFTKLTPWQKTQVARHPARPYFLDYVSALFTEFVELHGDRRYGDDRAIRQTWIAGRKAWDRDEAAGAARRL